jgi:hypothetical protein
VWPGRDSCNLAWPPTQRVAGDLATQPRVAGDLATQPSPGTIPGHPVRKVRVQVVSERCAAVRTSACGHRYQGLPHRPAARAVAFVAAWSRACDLSNAPWANGTRVEAVCTRVGDGATLMACKPALCSRRRRVVGVVSLRPAMHSSARLYLALAARVPGPGRSVLKPWHNLRFPQKTQVVPAPGGALAELRPQRGGRPATPPSASAWPACHGNRIITARSEACACAHAGSRRGALGRGRHARMLPPPRKLRTLQSLARTRESWYRPRLGAA